jgi:amidase
MRAARWRASPPSSTCDIGSRTRGIHVTTSGDMTSAPASALVRALRAREIGSRELLDAYLDRIEQVNPAINAVVTIDAEAARAAAAAADEQIARGQELGALHGLPMTVKDALETAGMRTTSGFPDLAQYVPARDADAVARLRGQGAVIFGTTDLPTFAMDWQTYNPIFGTTNNPRVLTRTPGGSSGGPAAAVAAGMTALDLGSDLSGSLRQPAHTTGVFTLKPSFGVVPGRGHIPGPPGTLSSTDMAVLGPIGRTADDLDLALNVLAGPDEWSATAWQLLLPPADSNALFVNLLMAAVSPGTPDWNPDQRAPPAATGAVAGVLPLLRCAPHPGVAGRGYRPRSHRGRVQRAAFPSVSR